MADQDNALAMNGKTAAPDDDRSTESDVYGTATVRKLRPSRSRAQERVL